MFTRSRYIHFHARRASKHNGFSVELEPAGDPDSPTTLVDVRYTICNKKDQFSRKQARLELDQKEFQSIKILKLPEFLAKLELSMWGSPFTPSREYSNRWAWVWKYFL